MLIKKIDIIKNKLFFSLSLLVYAFVVAIITGNKFVFSAMLCSTAGDILIMSSWGCFNNKKEIQFENGVIPFAMAHLAYLISMKTERSANTKWIVVCVQTAILLFKIKRRINL